jgi:hypothetical protein
VANFNELYRENSHAMEDFWSRRANAPTHERTIRVFGRPVLFCSNDPAVLDSANVAERMYSSAPWSEEPAWRVNLIVHDSPRRAGAPPARLIDRIHYAGDGDRLSIDLAGWGNCFVDMMRGEAHAVLASSLASRPGQVVQVLINTILTNFITRHGYSMLHASGLVKSGRILLLLAPHGTGKSTTALRLALNGYKLVSDSMIYVGEHDPGLWIGGFPVGRIKLRKDMLSRFPSLAAEAQSEPVRDETKHRLELDRLAPERTSSEMIRVHDVVFCLLERWPRSETRVEPLDPEDLWREIMLNSLHFDTPEMWRENLRRIGLLLERAKLHRLRIGSSDDQILKTVDQL